MNSLFRSFHNSFGIIRYCGYRKINCFTRVYKHSSSDTSISAFFRNESPLLRNLSPVTCSCRFYAKSKDKKKDKGKSKVQVNESQLAELVNVESLKNGMEKCINQLKEEFTKNLSLRSTTGSIESLKVNLDGKEHTLQEVAQVVRKNPKTLVINMSIFPQAIPAVLKAIQNSGMNLNPQQDGTTLYVPVPKVTKEFRESLSKNAKQLFVKCKNNIRDVQIKHIKSLKKKDKQSEDAVRSAEQQVAAIADTYIAEGEKILQSKQTELLGKD